MSAPITLEYVDQLATQLPAAEQLQLAARICERQSGTIADESAEESDTQLSDEDDADAVLARCDAAADLWEGNFDAAEDVRKIRAAQDEGVCPNK